MPKTIKTRSGRVLQLPTPEEDAIVTAAANADPDAVPLTDAEWEIVSSIITEADPGHLHPTAGASIEGRREGVLP